MRRGSVSVRSCRSMRLTRLTDWMRAIESLGADLAAISRNLYAALRTLDAAGLDLLLTHTYDDEGLGLALNDRLRRAAGGSLRPVE